MEQNTDIFEGIAIHCDTEEKAKVLLKFAYSFGLKWCNGDSFLEKTDYDVYRKNTCYNILNGTFAYKSFYENEDDSGLKVISFDDFFKNITKSSNPEDERQPGLSFPRLMLVKCRIEEKEWRKRVVFGKDDFGRFLFYGGDEVEEVADIERLKRLGHTPTEVFTCEYAKEIDEKEEIVELTLKDISEGKGVGISPHLIRIKIGV